MKPGDFVVVRTHGLAARLIQLGTLSRWNHAAIYLGDGRIIEANPSGVTGNPLSEYAADDVVASRYALTDQQRADIVVTALSYRGTPYGWADIVALALVALGIRPKWLDDYARRDDRIVCSQLVAACYDAAGLRLHSQDPWTVTPGDLAEFITEEN